MSLEDLIAEAPFSYQCTGRGLVLTDTGRLVTTLAGRTGYAFRLAFSPDGRWLAAARQRTDPTVAWGRSRSSVAGPIPRTLMRSSTVGNIRSPLAARIRSAIAGPTPGSFWSSVRSARLRSIRAGLAGESGADTLR